MRLERMGFIGSDHFPILVELSYEPGLVEEQEARDLIRGDRAMVHPPRPRLGWVTAYLGITAVVSISSLARSSISALTSTTAIAG